MSWLDFSSPNTTAVMLLAGHWCSQGGGEGAAVQLPIHSLGVQLGMHHLQGPLIAIKVCHTLQVTARPLMQLLQGALKVESISIRQQRYQLQLQWQQGQDGDPDHGAIAKGYPQTRQGAAPCGFLGILLALLLRSNPPGLPQAAAGLRAAPAAVTRAGSPA